MMEMYVLFDPKREVVPNMPFMPEYQDLEDLWLSQWRGAGRKMQTWIYWFALGYRIEKRNITIN